MQTLMVESDTFRYPIHIGSNLLQSNQVWDGLVKQLSPSSFFIITDTNVAKRYLDRLQSQLEQYAQTDYMVVEAGEASKSFVTYERLLTYALKQGFDRSTVIIALGGGVVGDLAGFTAATYLRGVPYIQIPTTLLAHDSSVGGKTGINHSEGKNMIGAFYQPAAVIYDVTTLKTLPEHEWRSGMAEVIKHGFIQNTKLLQSVKRTVSTPIGDINAESIENILYTSIDVKRQIVERDEKEKGERAFLNFGHTVGHAIEAELGYGEITHGEAVMIGMMVALKVSEHYYEVDLASNSWCEDMKSLGFSVRIPASCDSRSLIERMKRDKKSLQSDIRMVLLPSLGVPNLVKVDSTFIENILKEELEEV
ncbi:3-dehydroquinate synthase [Texcoconibacillus texcoconensis]|uniref:3-dehydroquinate synthase n=1 Tax=Texcoconibacillus texcoconensis TaxID=1095777 RepID=A0A840QNF4_9BACI|nr:3-dehydroquinate synthase [Texcoconibacillus texcoconensis]MBB5172888.1 3-dehydroquinate synthase [Texcoconibacillus texcoconensis]